MFKTWSVDLRSHFFFSCFDIQVSVNYMSEGGEMMGEQMKMIEKLRDENAGLRRSLLEGIFLLFF